MDKLPTTISVASSMNPSILGDSVTLTATVTVFAAASLKVSMDAQARQFESRTGDKVVVSYAASNALA